MIPSAVLADVALPQIAAGSNGEATVVWEDFGQRKTIKGSWGTIAGGFASPATVFAPSPGEVPADPQVAADGQGDAVVAWDAGRPDGATTGIWAAFRPHGGAFGSPLELTRRPSASATPLVSVNKRGDVVILWTVSAGRHDEAVVAFARAGTGRIERTLRLPGIWGPSGVGIDRDGRAVVVGRTAGEPVAVSVDRRGRASHAQTLGTERQAGPPQVAVDADGHATAVWSAVGGIYGAQTAAHRRFAAPIRLSGAMIAWYAIARDARGGALIAWSFKHFVTTGIAVRHWPAAKPPGAPGLVLYPPQQDDGANPTLAADGRGTAAIVWGRPWWFAGSVASGAVMRGDRRFGHARPLTRDIQQVAPADATVTVAGGHALAAFTDAQFGSSATGLVVSDIGNGGATRVVTQQQSNNSDVGFQLPMTAFLPSDLMVDRRGRVYPELTCFGFAGQTCSGEIELSDQRVIGRSSFAVPALTDARLPVRLSGDALRRLARRAGVTVLVSYTIAPGRDRDEPATSVLINTRRYRAKATPP